MARRVARVALLDCEDASKWSDHLDVWREALAGDDKSSSEELEWTRYKACQGELPTAAALENFDAIVVPGSHHSAVVPADGQHPPWMQAVMDVIRGVVARGHPQLFAACFGHQLLAATLGGRVDHGGQFVFKAENIELQARPWSAWVVRVSAVWTTTKNRSARASMRVTTLRAACACCHHCVFLSYVLDIYACSFAAWIAWRAGELAASADAREPRRCCHAAPTRSCLVGQLHYVPV